jgi:hypothetical protein
MMDNEFSEVFNRRSATLAPSSGPVGDPRGHRAESKTFFEK